MNFYFLVPGTGNFFCGTCLRDYALARALKAHGHTVKMLEMYLEHKVEGAEESDSPLFFGGINCYIQQKVPLFRKTPRALDAVFDSRPFIRFAATKTGMTDAHELAALTTSMLQGEAGNQFKELDRMADWLEVQPEKPDVIVLSNAMLSGVARKLKRVLGCQIVCTLQGEDAFIESLGEYTDQVWSMLNLNAKHIDGFVAVSQYYADKMTVAMSLERDKVQVVYNGIELDGFSPAEAPPAEPVIGFLSRMCPPKGLADLVEAFIALKQKPEHAALRLHVAGSQVNEDLAFVASLKQQLAAAGVGDAVRWLPNISKQEKQQFLREISLLCTPSRFDEAFGLFVLEGWATAVPVVMPARGAMPELIERCGGGLAVDDLTEGLHTALQDLPNLQAGAVEAREVVTKEFTADAMGRHFLEVVTSLR